LQYQPNKTRRNATLESKAKIDPLIKQTNPTQSESKQAKTVS
jgi:hypothetical protein